MKGQCVVGLGVIEFTRTDYVFVLFLASLCRTINAL